MEYLIWQCQAAMESNGGIMLSLFLAGLLGSINHCVGMCGPFVMAQVGAGVPETGQQNRVKVWERLRGGALLPYHMGRLTTYMFLGVLGASLSQFIVGSPLQRGVAVMLLFLAGALFLFSALPGLKHLLLKALNMEPKGQILVSHSSALGKMIGRASRPFFVGQTRSHHYVLGLMLGFMPCALVVAAIMAVAATAAPIAAALGMLVFGLGTIPALIGVGTITQTAKAKWPNGMHQISTGMMAINGAGLMVLAGGMVK